MELTKLRGFQDLLGAQARTFAYLERTARGLMERYGVAEARLPLLERVELFRRSSGETSDVVTKQMYTFNDQDEAGTTLALRPEGTPSLVRAYIEAGLDRTDPEQRLYYSGPMFRRERPQKGRYRQFYQFGVEILGRADPACDAEMLVMIDELRRELGLELTIEINSLGCAQCRPRFRQAVLDFGRAHWAELCGDCHERLERNPLRLLDCKNDARLTAAAPNSLDYLCEECRAHFAEVKALLAAAAVGVVVNPRIVRGLDYYTRTTFEVTSNALGTQNAVLAGGRYDGLVQALGGAPVAGCGFAIGLDRMVLALEAAGRQPAELPKVVVLTLGEAPMRRVFGLWSQWHGLPAQLTLLSPQRSLKSQLKRADRLGADYAVIIGEDELQRDSAQLRELKRGAQSEVALSAVLPTLQRLLSR